MPHHSLDADVRLPRRGESRPGPVGAARRLVGGGRRLQTTGTLRRDVPARAWCPSWPPQRRTGKGLVLTRETGARDSRAAHHSGDAWGSAIGRAILRSWCGSCRCPSKRNLTQARV